MRTSSQREEKFKKKVRGVVLESQVARQKDATKRQMEIELAVKEIVGVDQRRFFYHAFAKQVEKVQKKYKGEALINEVEILQNKWRARGLADEKLARIKEWFNIIIPPMEVCRFDIGKFNKSLFG